MMRNWWGTPVKVVTQDCATHRYTEWAKWSSGYYFQRRYCLDCGWIDEKRIGV